MDPRSQYVADVVLSSPEETAATAKRVADVLTKGDLILLTGGIGSGKTTFVQALGAALGIEETITSPSFVIQELYEAGRLPLSHVDLYRLGTREEIEEVGWEEYLDSGVTVIEWADRYAHFPIPYLCMDFSLGPGEYDRLVTVSATGGDWRERVLQIFERDIE